jgi:hypothetical protein
MNLARLRLTLAALLFTAWICWLAYLVISTGGKQPIVLSRPQVLVSELDVIAWVDHIEDDGTDVEVREVHWPKDQKDKEGKKLRVSSLAHCRNDWQGPGLYILPLMLNPNQTYQVAPVPPSPGYSQVGQTRIYPYNEETRKQLDAIDKDAILQPPGAKGD